MSRSGYSEDCDNDWALICWRGAVASATKGARGQSMLRELLAALDAMPEKKLIAHFLEDGPNVCALGALGRQRGLDMRPISPDNPDQCARAFGVAGALVSEIVYWNDEGGRHDETPEHRFTRMRAWVAEQIIEEKQ